MNNKITLDIPKPCSQAWHEMKPTAIGGFCQQCNKDVIDFTKMTTAELQRYFAQNRGEVCGRIDAGQMAQLNQLSTVDIAAQSRFQYKWLLASAFTLFVHSSANSQQPVLKEQSPTHLVEPGQLEKKKFTYPGVYEVKGIVKAAEDQSPIQQASVKVVSTNQGMVTDSLGRFKLMIKGELNQKLKLQISYLGYATQDVEVVLGHNKELVVELLPDNLLMGEFEVVGYQSKKSSVLVGSITTISSADIKACEKPSFFKRIINRVSSWFN